MRIYLLSLKKRALAPKTKALHNYGEDEFEEEGAAASTGSSSSDDEFDVPLPPAVIPPTAPVPPPETSPADKEEGKAVGDTGRGCTGWLTLKQVVILSYTGKARTPVY